MKWELLQLDTAPCVSTLCLSDVTTRDQISQVSPSVFTYCKTSKTGGGNSLGTRLHWVSMILNELVECRSLWGEPEGVRHAVSASTHNEQCMALRLELQPRNQVDWLKQTHTSLLSYTHTEHIMHSAGEMLQFLLQPISHDAPPCKVH